MNRADIVNSDSKSLGELIRDYEGREYQQLRDIVEHGSPEEREALRQRNHAGVNPLPWRPGLSL